MKYKIFWDGEADWINEIAELKNTKNFLHVHIDLIPKRLEVFQSQVFSGNSPAEYHFCLTVGEDTIYHKEEDKDKTQTIIIIPENQGWHYTYFSISKYSLYIVLIKESGKSKLMNIEKE